MKRDRARANPRPLREAQIEAARAPTPAIAALRDAHREAEAAYQKTYRQDATFSEITKADRARRAARHAYHQALEEHASKRNPRDLSKLTGLHRRRASRPRPKRRNPIPVGTTTKPIKHAGKTYVVVSGPSGNEVYRVDPGGLQMFVGMVSQAPSPLWEKLENAPWDKPPKPYRGRLTAPWAPKTWGEVKARKKNPGQANYAITTKGARGHESTWYTRSSSAKAAADWALRHSGDTVVVRVVKQTANPRDLSKLTGLHRAMIDADRDKMDRAIKRGRRQAERRRAHEAKMGIKRANPPRRRLSLKEIARLPGVASVLRKAQRQANRTGRAVRVRLNPHAGYYLRRLDDMGLVAHLPEGTTLAAAKKIAVREANARGIKLELMGPRRAEGVGAPGYNRFSSALR